MTDRKHANDMTREELRDLVAEMAEMGLDLAQRLRLTEDGLDPDDQPAARREAIDMAYRLAWYPYDGPDSEHRSSLLNVDLPYGRTLGHQPANLDDRRGPTDLTDAAAPPDTPGGARATAEEPVAPVDEAHEQRERAARDRDESRAVRFTDLDPHSVADRELIFARLSLAAQLYEAADLRESVAGKIESVDEARADERRAAAERGREPVATPHEPATSRAAAGHDERHGPAPGDDTAEPSSRSLPASVERADSEAESSRVPEHKDGEGGRSPTVAVGDGPLQRAEWAVLELRGRRALEDQYARQAQEHADDANAWRSDDSGDLAPRRGDAGPTLSAFDD